METRCEQLTDGQLLATLDAVLDALTDDRFRCPTDREHLDTLVASLRVNARLHAWQTSLAARVEASEAAWREHGTSTTTWLAESQNMTQQEARRLIKSGQDLDRFPIVRAAAASGQVLPSQTDAITTVLRALPVDFPTTTVIQAQELLVGFAATHNSVELRRLTGHLLEVLAPETADALEAERLERELAEANRKRFLDFRADGRGSILFRGSLPVVDAEPLIRIVDAYTAAQKRALDDLDPHAEYVSPSMRRADGLLAMVTQHSRHGSAPVNGGDRPRITITLDYASLLARAIAAGIAGPGGCLVSTGEPIAPSEIRHLLCDADLLPIVLGGASEILDVGRAERLVTAPIRAALEQRDRGCIFPGCDTPPSDATPTTSSPGGQAATPRLRIWPSSVPTTTASSNPATTPTPTAGESISATTASPTSSPRNASTRDSFHDSTPASEPGICPWAHKTVTAMNRLHRRTNPSAGQFTLKNQKMHSRHD